MTSNVLPLRPLVEPVDIFNFNGIEIRIFDRNGEPWFVGKDICTVLDLKNTGTAYSKLENDEKGGVVLNDGEGRPQNYTIVNESGLYSLILTSRKPEAKQFKRWITHEVLPAIRKTGSYSISQKSDNLPEEHIIIRAIERVISPIIKVIEQQGVVINIIQSQTSAMQVQINTLQTHLTRFIELDDTNRIIDATNKKKILELTMKVVEQGQSGLTTVSDYMKTYDLKLIPGKTIPMISNFISDEMARLGYGHPQRHVKTNTRLFPIKMLKEFFENNTSILVK